MGQLKVFYDGKCAVCFAEMKHYRNRDKNNNLKLIDISASNFNAKDFGLDPKEVVINMHSIDENGKVHIGVDTFAQIWRRITPYNKIEFILNNKTLRPIFDWGYKIFAYKIRPNLPRRKCDNDNCEIMV